MSVLQIQGLVGSALVLVFYVESLRLRDPRLFVSANAVLWLPIGAAALEAQAWGPLLITLGFGWSSLFTIVKGYRDSIRD